MTLMNLQFLLKQEASFSLYYFVQIQFIILRYQIVAGERRWRAAQLAKIHQVPSIIRDLNEEECFQIALIENVQRKDLNVIEEALGYQNLINRHDYKQEQLAVIIGKSRSHIANLLRLLFLPKSVQNLILDSKLTMGQSRPLIGNDNAENLAKIIVAKGLSAREVEKLGKRKNKKRFRWF